MENQLFCIVDIGGTKILLLLIDSGGTVLFREKAQTPEPASPEAVVETVRRLFDRGASRLELPALFKPSGLGVCMAGFTDYKTGLVHQAPNLGWDTPVPLGSHLEESLSCPVLIENDANAAVLGEVYYGAARGHHNVIYITLSTGIGGGLFLNGRLYRGSDGFAGEIGHIKSFGQGRPCKCLGYDCLEAWASGSAIARNALSAGLKGEAGEEVTTARVFEQADRGMGKAKEVIEQAAARIGRGLANLVTLLNPSCMVVGGGVAANRADFLTRVTGHVMNNAIRPSVEVTPLLIVPSELEPEAGIWGMHALITGKTE